nr:hypothetical protein [Argonema antarcticum]
MPARPNHLPSVSIVLVISIITVISIVAVISIVPAIPNRELGSATIPHPNTIPVIAPIPVASAVRELSDESYTAICIHPTKSPLAIITLTSYNSLRLGWDASSENRAYTNRQSGSNG